MPILSKNLLIEASAGSGKTFQLGNRVIGLVAAGVEPATIVALTFTRKAAGEFADSVLAKLAAAAVDAEAAASLRQAIDMPEADFQAALERVVRSLPRFTLGTMDGFFARVVRAFQYELGLAGGLFELVEGPRAAALGDELLAAVLGDALGGDESETFYHAFRRATIGREDQGVLRPLRAYIGRWQERYQENDTLAWGPEQLAPDLSPEQWESAKHQLAAALRPDVEGLVFTDGRQPAALAKCIDLLETHTIGSGSLGGQIPSLLKSLFEAVASGPPPLAVKCYKDLTIDGACGETLHAMIELAARCELAAALHRTRALHHLIAVYDAVCARRLRSRGLLGFHDVKLLMGRWARDEDSRLRREAVDFRLDARIHHWLLDEFQDTSRADWTGLLPLIDEAAGDGESSLFVVGDRKQAIYGWRGGDVRLFDEVIDRFGGGLEIESMAESWRSCPEVLALVNRVCGDLATMKSLFGEAASRWHWQDHAPAPPLTQPHKAGEARVEIAGDWDDRLDRLATLLDELGVGKKSMTCGVLLRGNDKVRQTADFLRARGFDVIEEGRRLPALDNPPGIFILHLLQWLANPADSFAREVLRMSPLAATIAPGTDEREWRRAWERLSETAARTGFAPMVGGLIATAWPDWSDFAKRRAGDLLGALGQIDRQGTRSAREAADWLERFEISQSPGIAAVQVMTIHKSKGLGFDLVALPEIPDVAVPQAQYFEVAEGPGWISETPPKWAREIVPVMREAEDRWAEAQRYEAFCMLYVALTRAKRGLYVLLEAPAKSADPARPSLANWLRHSLDARDATEGTIWQSGQPGWSAALPDFATQPESAAPARTPGPARPPRRQTTPSAAKHETQSPKPPATLAATGGLAFGSDVHKLLESVRWIDDEPPELPAGPAGQLVSSLIRTPALREVFERAGRDIRLLNEQPVDAILDDTWTSGVIDRLHLHFDPDGTPHLAEIIDFKTDAVNNPAELADRYSAQMTAYAAVLARAYPGCRTTCRLLSTRHAALVDLPLAGTECLQDPAAGASIHG